MPQTLQYRPLLIDTLISNERIRSYQMVFHPADDVELMGAYLWNSHVCGALYPLIGAAEISLRNAIDHALVQALGRFWWASNKLHYRSFSPQAEPPHAVRAVQENFTKATRAHIAEQRRRHAANLQAPPQHDGVISKTEFSTWEFVLNREFLGRGLIWPKNISMVFRGKWPTQRAGAVLDHVRDLVSTIRDFRNRLFHHEPAWKRYGIKNQADALQHLQEKIRAVESLLALIHPEALRVLQVNGLLRDARRACSAPEIQRFQHLAHIHHVESLGTLKALVDRSTRENIALPAQTHRGEIGPFLILPQ